MKFIISVEQLLNNLLKLNLVVPSKSVLPILSNIYVRLEGNTLYMLTSDLETFISTEIEVEGKKDGNITIPAKKFVDLVRLLTDKYDSIAVDVAFNRDVYNTLEENLNFVEYFGKSISYDFEKGKLILKGIITEQEKEEILQKLNDYGQTLGQEGAVQIKENLNVLIESLSRLFELNREIVNKAGSKRKLTFEADEKNHITITSKYGKYSIFGESGQDFPMPDEIQNGNTLRIDGSRLRAYLMKIRHSTKMDEVRRNMSGIYFDIKSNELILVATDGYRLSIIHTNKYEQEIKREESFIVPLKTANLIMKLCSSNDVKIHYDQKLISISFGDIELFSKLIDDSYPNYETVLPKDNDKILKIRKKELIDSLRRVSIFTDSITRKAKMQITNDTLTLSADNPEVGEEGVEILNCEFRLNNGEEFDFTKNPYVIAFNVGYLLDCLEVIDSDDVIFSFSAPLKASTVEPSVQPENESFLELIMPIRA